MIVITSRDDELNRSVLARSNAIGTALADEWKTQMGLLIRDVLNITPPSSGSGSSGSKGYQQGQGAINRDLFWMGFIPVSIKGHRMIDHVPAGNVKGRPAMKIEPVSVATHPNPKFEDPDAFHAYRLLRKSQMHRSRVSRGGGKKGQQGGAQAFYVGRGKFQSMKSRLYKEIGKLAAPWLPAIRQLFDGVLPYWVPAWIARHEGDVAGRGRSLMNLNPQSGVLFIRVTNSMPDTAIQQAEDTQRRIEAAKVYRVNAIRRGLEGRAKRIARSYRH
jgi:hypothetical protein